MQPESSTIQKGNKSKGESKDNDIGQSVKAIEAALKDLGLATEDKRRGKNIELTPEQQSAYDKCVSGERSVFCTGGAGCGKSVVLSAAVRAMRSSPGSELVSVTASTGAAALLIGGTTLHRFAGVGIEERDLDTMVQRVTRGRAQQRWKDTSTLVIDEISMVSPTFFENLSRLASVVRCDPRPFGGIRVIVFGDFLQLPPVSTARSRGSDKRYIFQTATWMNMNFEKVSLTSSVRQSSDVKFKSILEEIRFGRLNGEVVQYMRSLDRPLAHNDTIEPVRLCATKRSANVYNEEKLDKIDSLAIVFESEDSGDTRLLKQYFSEDQLILKVGAQVMLTRNLSPTLVNGSTGTVIRIDMIDDKPVPMVIFASCEGTLGSTGEQTISVQPVAWEIIEGVRVVATRIQTPLILAWALTIHKSQGKTIPLVSVDAQGVFETGQLYVALSRCPRSSGVQVVNFSPSHVMADSVCVSLYMGMSRAPVTKRIPKKVAGN